MIETRNIYDSYKYYKSEDTSPVSYKLYTQIVYGFIKFMVQRLFEGFEIKLGPGDSLGTMVVIGKKIEPKLDKYGNIHGTAPDWGATKKLWDSDPVAKANKVIVRCINEATNFIRYRVRWYKYHMKLHNKAFYSVKLSRANKRALSKLIKNGKEFYVINKNYVSHVNNHNQKG